jgi:hypothetical protein
MKLDINNLKTEDIFLIYYEDASMPPEVIYGKSEAEESFKRRKDHWNCFLFQCVKDGANFCVKKEDNK